LLDLRQSRSEAADPRSRGRQREQLPGHAPRVPGRDSAVRRDAPVRADADEARRIPGRRDPRESSPAPLRRLEVRGAKPGRAVVDLLAVRWMMRRRLHYKIAEPACDLDADASGVAAPRQETREPSR